MKCPECQAQNHDDAMFCWSCGLRLGPFPRHEQPYAPWGRRILALLIDTALLAAVYVALIDQPFWARVLLTALTALAYFTFLEGQKPWASLGKLAAGIYVAPRKGGVMDLKSAAIRNALKTATLASTVFGVVFAAVSARKQMLHDLLLDTVVLRRQDAESTFGGRRNA